jgi:S1-C subfamily serine protease
MALIPPDFLNSVTSIEIEKKKKNGEVEKIPIATGFLFGKNTGKNDVENNALYSIFLITNRHVFEDEKTKIFRREVYLRFNIGESQEAKSYKITLLNEKNQPLWIRHKNENVDIAILPISGQKLKEEGIRFFFFAEGLHTFLSSQFKEIGISTGDGIFVLGFPLGIRGKTRNFVIVRQGIVARVDEEVLKEHFFFIDAQIYPGSSGGPVILKPEQVSIIGTKSVGRAGLIGVISKGITYQEVAISEQTGRPRIVFEEQTGLVAVVPVDLVIEAIDTFLKEKGEPKSKEKIQ